MKDNREVWDKYSINWGSHAEKVIKFNKLCGASNRDHKDLVHLYKNLCKEEASEAIAAYNLEDIQGNTISEEQALNDLVDAGCDLFYVGYYYHWLEQGPYLQTKQDLTLTHALARLEGWDIGFRRLPLDCSIIILTDLKVDPDEALNKVHESNFSKFIDVTGIPLEDITEIAEAEVEEIKQAYKAKGKPLKKVTYQVNPYQNESWLAFYNEDGKVLKPSSFFEPDFTDVIKHLL
jgi:predicted HAD superfamily Cof-like phosphohydrolase